MSTPIDYQAGFNIMMGIGAFLASWWMKAIWSAIKELRETDKELVSKVSNIELLVAGQYARKEELDRLASTINTKLDRIEHLEVVMANQYVQKSEFTEMLNRLFAKIDRIDEKLDRSK